MKPRYGQMCPVAMACEVFAERWTPIILRELFAGSTRFNEIQRGIPLVSRALLARRLRALQSAGIVAGTPLRGGGRGREYRLTDAGKEFGSVIEGLGTWGQRWTVRVDRRNLDAGYLMWNIRRGIPVDHMPARRTVARFDYRGIPAGYRGPRTFWLVLKRPDADLCLSDPGHEVDLYVDADLAAMAKVWLGDLPLSGALRSQAIRLIGPRSQMQAFSSWLPLNPFAGVPRP